MDGWTILQMFYLSGVCVFGTVGNALVILAVLTTPSLRQRSNFFIVVLAICDLNTSAISLPFYILTLGLGYWPFRDTSCVVVGYFTLWSLGFSVTTLSLIAGNRYVSVTRPRHAYLKLCNYFTLAMAVFGQLLLGMGVIITPTIIGIGRVGFNPILGHCSFVYSSTKEWFYPMIMFLGGVVSSMLLLPTYYAMTFYIVRSSRIKMNMGAQKSSPSSNQGEVNTKVSTSKQISPGELRFTKKLVLLFALFLLCWLPYSMVVFCDSQLSVPVLVQRLTNTLLWSNAAINPFLYAWMMKRFRQAYKRILTLKCFKRCRQVSSGEEWTVADTASTNV